MKIAVPTADKKLCMHFGHCDEFALVDADMAGGKITGTVYVTPPPHEPGLLPKWLHEKGVETVIAGGMGVRAQNLFSEKNIRVIAGAPEGSPEELVKAFLDGTLKTGGNACSH
jgi:predicted Fe-Mo cluster-binding NifX family protein